ncbi:hypothetical protein [Shewanella youngdeokensis]|uniref:S41 family peptidase n=1 Tax=Shewanella youngdeokensis TaxID=2999068 RepID=A0ABZ0K117_9GAMM|nr:S41 family peptidase [Shewanella sp. DAU334]
MTVSFKTIVLILTLIMTISAVQLIRLSFFPQRVSYQLSIEQQRQDIQQLLNVINQKSAFTMLDPARKNAFTQQGQLLLAATTQTSNAAIFQIKLQHWLTTLNDPAANITLPPSMLQHSPLLVLPTRLQHNNQNWIASQVSGQLINEDYPLLTHINGLPMQRWVIAAQRYIPDSLKLSVTEQSQWLQHINRLQLDIGLASSTYVTLTLANREAHTIQYELDLVNPGQLTAINKMANMPPFIIRYPAEHNLKQTVMRQLAAADDSTADLYIDIRELKVSDTALSAWLYERFAVPHSPYNNTVGLIKYRRYPNSNAKQFAKYHFKPIEQLGFFEQVNLETLGFDSQRADSPDFSRWLTRPLPKSNLNDGVTNRQLYLLIDATCQQECEWLALMASAWPNVTLIGEQSRGSLSPRHRVMLQNSGLEAQFSAALAYSAAGKLISGIGITPAFHIDAVSLNQQNIANVISAKLSPAVKPRQVSSLSAVKRSP